MKKFKGERYFYFERAITGHGFGVRVELEAVSAFLRTLSSIPEGHEIPGCEFTTEILSTPSPLANKSEGVFVYSQNMV
jgi:hypothetical protein